MYALAVLLTLAAADGSEAAPDAPVRAPETCKNAEESSSADESGQADEDEASEGLSLKAATRASDPGSLTLRPRVRWAESPEGDEPGFRLVDPEPATGCSETPATMDWVWAAAALVLPRETTTPGRGQSPALKTEFGLRTEVRLGMVRMRAEGLARIDARGSGADASTSVRMTPKGQINLEAHPTDQVHFGVEFSHRDEHGLDALPSSTRGMARLRVGF
ncbi:MAG: hypothetical protein AAGA54_30765 [Myxococcota bacterium]